ncbi:MAG TPA: hypothetical protein VG244_07145 [Acidimicrobiales bacterium]|nr:hypothetical protein [Acidimicrobiales bacterium]
MTGRRLTAFIDALVSGRRPDSYRADPEDVEVLGAAIALRAARPGDAVPDDAFVAELYQSLGEENSTAVASNVRPLRMRRSRAALIGVAASIALVGATFGATEASNNGATTTSAIQAPHGKILRTASFETSQGQALGQIVVYGGSPGWVFMNVDLPTSNDSVKCELRMLDGSVVAAGTVDLRHGTGVLSKKIHVDTSRLQGATLYGRSGAVVASATFA